MPGRPGWSGHGSRSRSAALTVRRTSAGAGALVAVRCAPLRTPSAENGHDDAVDPVDALKQIAYRLERTQEPTYRVRAYRKAAWALEALGSEEVRRRAAARTLTDVADVGPKTAQAAIEAIEDGVPKYLEQLQADDGPLAEGGEQVRAALRGDLHTHSDWTDGGSPPDEMTAAAKAVGHEYIAIRSSALPRHPGPVRVFNSHLRRGSGWLNS